MRDRLMMVRIEIGAQRLDGPDAPLPQDLHQLPLDQFDAAAIGLGPLAAGIGLERALEVVDQRQQLAEQIGGSGFGLRLPLALGAPAVIVELRGLPQQQILELVALPLELVGAVRRAHAARRAFALGRGNPSRSLRRFTEIDIRIGAIVFHGCFERRGATVNQARPPTMRLMVLDRPSTALMARE